MAFQNNGGFGGGNYGGGNSFGGGRQGGFPPRQMVDVSALGLKCADCSVDIKELPFQPKANLPVYCRACNSNRRKSMPPRQY